MVRDQRRQHLSVMVGGQDALDDHVDPAVKGEPGREVDQVDVRAAGHVSLPEHLPAEVVLAHDRQAAAVPASQFGRDGGFSRRRVAADHDQPGRILAFAVAHRCLLLQIASRIGPVALGRDPRRVASGSRATARVVFAARAVDSGEMYAWQSL
jgi:hypothetical protein